MLFDQVCKISCVNTKRNKSVIVELRNITRKRFIPIYMKIMESLENTDNLLTFYQFPYQIWHSIYSTNLIESLNKEIKRQTKKKVLFPSEEALERYLVTLFEDYNFKQSQ